MNDSGNEQGNAAAAGQAFQVGDWVRFDWYGDMHEGVVSAVMSGSDGEWLVVPNGKHIPWRPLARNATLISRPTPTPAPTQTMLTCGQCGNMGYSDSWPFVAVRQFADGRDRADAVLCEDCWRDATPHLRATPAQTAPRYCATCCGALTDYEQAQGWEYCHDCIAEPEPATPAPAAYRDGDVVITALGGRAVVTNPGGDGWYWLRDSQGRITCSHADNLTPAATAALDTHTLELPVEMLCEHCAGTGIESGERWDCPACEGRGSFPRRIRLSDEAVDRLAGELAKRLQVSGAIPDPYAAERAEAAECALGHEPGWDPRDDIPGGWD